MCPIFYHSFKLSVLLQKSCVVTAGLRATTPPLALPTFLVFLCMGVGEVSLRFTSILVGSPRPFLNIPLYLKHIKHLCNCCLKTKHASLFVLRVRNTTLSSLCLILYYDINKSPMCILDLSLLCSFSR